MTVIDKNRLSLVAQLIASCAVVAACGGGGGSDATSSALSADTATTASAAATTSSDTTEADRVAAQTASNTYSSTVAAAAVAAPAPAAATTAAVTTAANAVAATTTAATAAATALNVVTSGPTNTATMSSTTMAINNPERGFYGWGGSYFDEITAGNLQSIRNAGYSLTIGLIDLSSYRNQSIPSSYLNTLTNQFALLRSNGVKVILRPVYNYDSSGADASVSMVKTHISQLAPLFAANADVIAYFQAGFVGAWGEWHDSQSGLTTDSNKATIRDAIMAAVPSQFPVSFRYPPDVIKWFPTALTAVQALTGGTQSRIGIHNDCFMSNDSDVGTFSSNALTNNPQRIYTAAITEFAPFGGETCSGFSPARMSCSDILSEGAQYHLAYLNLVYDVDFINSWKSGGCFDQVARSMGYRLQLDKVVAPQTAQRNTAVSVNVNLHNVGWSRMFSPRKIVVTLKNKSTGALITATGTTDMRTLPSQSSTSTSAPVTVSIPSSAAAGQYSVLVSMPDIYSTTASDARFAVRFANADDSSKSQSWDASNARFDTGLAITVQ